MYQSTKKSIKNILFFTAFIIPLFVTAQKKTVTLEDLNKYATFYSKSISGLKSTSDGNYYTTLEGGKKIVRYSYSSGKQDKVVMNLEDIKDCPIDYIQGYEFNSTNTRILVYTNRENIYRRTYKANYYIYDIKRKEIKPLSEEGKQQAAIFSPDGNMVAFVKDNDVYIHKILFGTEARVTNDGEFNKIINGVPDWVYEEEFEFNRAMEWSPNSMELAYLRFDESNVKQYKFPLYKGSHPTQEEYALYPGEYKFKYPKAGEDNSKVEVKVFHVKNRTTKTMAIEGEDYYIPRIRWTYEDGKLGILKLNRLQNQFDLLIANTASTLTKSVFTHRNDYYIAEDVLDNLTFLPGGDYFVYVGEMDGYNHIHLYTMAGMKVRQLTKGDWDVTEFYGYDANKKLIYYQAAKVAPMQREIYAVSLDAKKNYTLSTEQGTNSAQFSATYKYYVNNYSSTTTPPKYTLHDQSGKQLRTLEDNSALETKLKAYEISPKEFFTFKTSEGVELNGWMVKPLNFDASKQYPVLMTQYSGPNSQEVLDRWSIGWEQYLASQGYLVACVDPRGTGARGEEFRKCTYMKLGKYESDDQIEAAKYLGTLSYTDASRIAIWGWSYGGFMSCSCLGKGNGVFKVGIAVAPVTNWRYYDSVYTERYMRKPQENPKGYDENSPINMAQDLSGRLFIIHGSADDNVHYQNTVEYVEQLIQAGKQFDMFVYPNRNHSIYGGNTRMHLYQMMSDYLKRNL
ncbi:S9 family peptidase [Plebeiibacterium sediminum]|uniref:S9 family peptidase n=1 Tax=Plebeiibacterium sediminum TaxID=2992112 RepID=A0AAE3M2T0_9BACT|nr:S9 family peptidase [Plebeiobacterium sediminum]MCW3785710.1 S9 family peptidase [Plebeiobacterium sediminum]